MRSRLAICVLTCAVFVPFTTSAATIEELQAQMQQLQVLISQISTRSQVQNSILPPTSCPALARTLTRDMSGEDVQQLQQFLITRSLLAVDSATGFFGPLTETAVQQFQCSQGIACGGDGYGIAGPRTRAAIATLCFQSASQSLASGSKAITGWAWGGEDNDSDGSPDTGIGWVALHCSSTSAGCTSGGGSWGLALAPDGTIQGYAWSSNIGWISAYVNECPRDPCAPRIGADGKFSGWLKALSANGSWDGWISLGDTNPSDTAPYGVILNGTTVSGFAWGGDVVGWLRFTGSTAALPIQ